MTIATGVVTDFYSTTSIVSINVYSKAAVRQNDEDIRSFGVYSSDLHGLCQWLKEENVDTVALESTGTYWQNLFIMLQDYGLNPILVSGKFTKNVQGKKTDVKDCQWIQRLHMLGLLPNSFQPDNYIEKLAFQMTGGIDLSEIDGVSGNTILAIISEIGVDVSKFATAKHFASWLRLSPNNKISG